MAHFSFPSQEVGWGKPPQWLWQGGGGGQKGVSHTSLPPETTTPPFPLLQASSLSRGNPVRAFPNALGLILGFFNRASKHPPPWREAYSASPTPSAVTGSIPLPQNGAAAFFPQQKSGSRLSQPTLESGWEPSREQVCLVAALKFSINRKRLALLNPVHYLGGLTRKKFGSFPGLLDSDPAGIFFS